MAMTEERRHELYEALKEKLGSAPATTLMEAIPPVGWADVATKHDLAQLEERMDLRFDITKAELRIEIAGVRTELHDFRAEMYERLGDLQRNLVLGMVAAQAAFAGVVIAAVRLMTS